MNIWIITHTTDTKSNHPYMKQLIYVCLGNILNLFTSTYPCTVGDVAHSHWTATWQDLNLTISDPTLSLFLSLSLSLSTLLSLSTTFSLYLLPLSGRSRWKAKNPSLFFHINIITTVPSSSHLIQKQSEEKTARKSLRKWHKISP